MPKTTAYRQGKRRKMKKLRIDELSSVDMPAQEGASALLLKRKASDDADPRAGSPSSRRRRRGQGAENTSKDATDVEKSTIVLVTSEEDGHTHSIHIWDDTNGGDTGYGKGPEDDESHAHPWMRQGTTITIGANDGHTHTVDAESLFEAVMASKDASSTEDTTMPEIDEAAVTAAEQKATEATKRADRAEEIVKLSPARRAHFDTLDAAGQDTFLIKTAPEQEADIAKAASSDPVVFTAADGTEFRKSDDARLIKMARERDEDRATTAKALLQVETSRIEKRATDELGSLPGELSVRGAIVKALESIEDEAVRKAAFESVVAGNAALSKAFVRNGSSTLPQSAAEGNVTKTDAETGLDNLAKAYAKEHSVTFAKAYAEVSSTPEGQRLYAEYTDAAIAAN